MTVRVDVPDPNRQASPPATGTAGRVAVIGDVGGHRDALAAELARLGADPQGRLPDDLVVVQVGDLVHRGPDSAGVLELVDARLRDQPGQWIQLVGNHEAQYLRDPAFRWPERLDASGAALLRTWRADGRLSAAAALTTGSGEQLLLSHAGITAGYWRQVLGAPDSAAAAASRLNELLAADDDRLFRGGTMLGGGAPDPLAGPLWAEAASELLPSWAGVSMPFGQVHGHSVATSHGRLAPALAVLTRADRRAGHEETRWPDGRIVGVDPGHRRRPARSWSALVFD